MKLCLISLTFLLLAFLLMNCADNNNTQDNRFYLKNTHLVTLDSEHTGVQHQLVITVPDSYAQNPNKTYPVLYYTDAYWDAPALHSTLGNLLYDGLAPEFIMVGFSYPGNADYGLERGRDLTPTAVPERAPMSGGADKFLKFVKQTAIPFVEEHYRINPQQRALAGSSLGGLFVLTAMYKEPGLFSRYLALSPAVDWDNNYLAKLDEAYARQHDALNARVYISYSEEEYAPFRQPIIALQKQIVGRNYQSLMLKNHALEGMEHASVKAAAYVHGLIWAWEDLAPPGPSGLERDFKAFVKRVLEK